jgi:hypothetical protein
LNVTRPKEPHQPSSDADTQAVHRFGDARDVASPDADKREVASPDADQRFGADPHVQHWLALQQTHGNAYVQRMIALQMEPAAGATSDADRGNGSGAAPLPQWVNATPKEPLPGETVPGYEQPREQYTQDDRLRLLAALQNRENENRGNVGDFVSEYASAMTELWGNYVGEQIAKASDDAEWGLLANMFSFALRAGLMALLTGGAGAIAAKLLEKAVQYAATSWTVKAVLTITEKSIEFGLDEGNDYVKSQYGNEQVQSKRNELSRLGAAISAAEKRELETAIVDHLGNVAAYGYFLGDPLSDLSRFRIPALFPRVDPSAIRATVAGAIVAVVAPSHVAVTQGSVENVISMSLEAGPDTYVAVNEPPTMDTSDDLAGALAGQPISLMPGAPLRIRLIGRAESYERLLAAIGGDPENPEDSPFCDPEPLARFRAAYAIPDRPINITREKGGTVSVYEGGLAEHLYLWERATGDKTLATLLAQAELEVEPQHVAAESDDAAPVTSQRRSAEELAPVIKRLLFSVDKAGAMALIDETISKIIIRAR